MRKLVLVMFLFGCDDPDGGGGAALGTLGQACYPNGTCNAELECFRSVCVPADDVSEIDDGADGADGADAPDVSADTHVPDDTMDTTPADTLPVDTSPADTIGVDTSPADTTSDTASETSADVDAPPAYYAVIVDDSHIFPSHRIDGSDPCATASSPANMHGADIDAVGLYDGDELIGYFDAVNYQEGGLCPNKPISTNDPEEATGAPDATLTTGIVSLGGGWLAGEFDFAVEVLTGYTVVVYETGTTCGDNAVCGGVDEGYEVFVAEDLDCPSRDAYPYRDCAVRLTGSGKGVTTLPVIGF